MTGRGEKVTPVRGIAGLRRGACQSRPASSQRLDVYGALSSRPPLSGEQTDAEIPDFAGSFERLLDHAAPRGNDLEAAALQLGAGDRRGACGAPARSRARISCRLSGSGPTCFALLRDGG